MNGSLASSGRLTSEESLARLPPLPQERDTLPPSPFGLLQREQSPETFSPRTPRPRFRLSPLLRNRSVPAPPRLFPREEGPGKGVEDGAGRQAVRSGLKPGTSEDQAHALHITSTTVPYACLKTGSARLLKGPRWAHSPSRTLTRKEAPRPSTGVTGKRTGLQKRCCEVLGHRGPCCSARFGGRANPIPWPKFRKTRELRPGPTARIASSPGSLPGCSHPVLTIRP